MAQIVPSVKNPRLKDIDGIISKFNEKETKSQIVVFPILKAKKGNGRNKRCSELGFEF